jgi:hypothetical protein
MDSHSHYLCDYKQVLPTYDLLQHCTSNESSVHFLPLHVLASNYHSVHGPIDPPSAGELSPNNLMAQLFGLHNMDSLVC